MSAPDIRNLLACTNDSKAAGLDTDPGPSDPTSFNPLRGRLVAARPHFPPLYLQSFVDPYIAKLNDLGQDGFTQIIADDPTRERGARLMFDIAHCILQNGEGFEARATDAFQEVISDLYDGFLSAEDRRGVLPPDDTVIAPLVKWGQPDFGPYTFPSDATQSFNVEPALVSLPPSNARKGLLAWAALGHETAGHDILDADTGLRGELVLAVRNAVDDAGLAEYWSSRIDETAADVMGILNMGPAAGIGLIGFFRGLNAAFGGAAKLRNNGPDEDPHPADIVRGYLAAETVALLQFSDRAEWTSAIADETDKDVSSIRLAGVSISKAAARQSARLVAGAIVNTPMNSLEGHALGQIQNWRDADETTVQQLRGILSGPGQLPEQLASGIFAAHAVAAGVTAALEKDADVAGIFDRMLTLLKRMHDGNAAWGPLFVRHPGNLAMHRWYMPQEVDKAEPVRGGRGNGRGANGHSRRARSRIKQMA